MHVELKRLGPVPGFRKTETAAETFVDCQIDFHVLLFGCSIQSNRAKLFFRNVCGSCVRRSKSVKCSDKANVRQPCMVFNNLGVAAC